MGDVLTLSDLRRMTGKPAHIINYALNRFGPQPTSRIGLTRVWRQSDLPAIASALERTSARSHRHVSGAANR